MCYNVMYYKCRSSVGPSVSIVMRYKCRYRYRDRLFKTTVDSAQIQDAEFSLRSQEGGKQSYVVYAKRGHAMPPESEGEGCGG